MDMESRKVIGNVQPKGRRTLLHQRSLKTRVGEATSATRDYDGEQPDGVRGGQTVKRNRGPEGTLRLGTWNVGSMSKRSGEIVDAMIRRKVEICCLQETRWRGGSARWMGNLDSRFKFYWQGCSSSVGGVGILLSERLVSQVVHITRVCERLMLLKLLMNKKIVNVISAYAPQSGRSTEEKMLFWQQLNDLVADIPEREMILLGGDLNGHVGASADGYEEVHGGFGFGIRNEGGEHILDFSLATSLVISNTCFHKQENHLITYESGGRKSQIDFIMLRKEDRRLVKNVKVIAGEECVSQHRLVVADLLMKRGKRIRKKFVPKLKVWKLQDGNVLDRYKVLIAEKAAGIAEVDHVNEKWLAMKKAWVDASNEVCGWSKGHPKHRETWWWNETVKQAVEKKRRCYHAWRSSGTEADHELYKAAKRESRKVVWEAQQRKSEEISDELIAAQNRNRLFKAMKLVVKDQKDFQNVAYVKNENNNIVTNKNAVKATWKNYMQSIMNTENEWDNDTACQPVEGPRCLLTKEEYAASIKECAKKKAPGLSGVVTELIEASGSHGLQWLTDLGNEIISEGHIPSDWKMSALIPIYKGKGDPLQCSSYRGIKLLEHALKVHERVLEKRIRAQATMRDMQFGFMPGKGTTDAIFIVRQLQEKFLAKEKPIFFAFIDLEKAFDRIPREVVKWALRSAKVEEWLVQAAMMLFDASQTVVRTGVGDTEAFEVKTGVHQGSVLSPLLFIIVMDAVAARTGNSLPWEILYADDLVLMAETEEELVIKIKAWRSNFAAKGMKVNPTKSKVMISSVGAGKVATSGNYPCGVCSKGVGSNSILCTSCQRWTHRKCSGVKDLRAVQATFVCKGCQGLRTNPVTYVDHDVAVDGDVYEAVPSFCYLGDVLDAGGGCEAAAAARIRAGWRTFHELSSFLTSRIPSLQMKGKVFRACVQSCMSYAGETWALKASCEKRLDTAEMSMVRRMCGVSLRDRYSNAELRERMKLEPVSNIIRRNRMRWFGHVYRKKEDDWVKKTWKFEVAGRRPKGRPKKTWDETVANDCRLLNLRPEAALDRQKWRSSIRRTVQPN